MVFRRQLARNRNGISSFSLLAIIVLLFASFTVTYISYVTNIDMSYRIKMNELSKMDVKANEAIQDLEEHAVYMAQRSLTENAVDDFSDEYSEYVNRMASEGFDIWRGGDVTVSINGVYSDYGGTLDENYTVQLAPHNGGYRVNGTFHVTIKNLRMDTAMSKVLSFDKMIYPPYYEFP